MIERFRPFAALTLLPLALLTGANAYAQTCGPPDLQPLKQPAELTAVGGVLSTTLVAQMRANPCVPVFNSTTNTWTQVPMTLRTYGFPTTPGSSQLTFATPGPTFRVRRATTSTSGDGDALRILLVNQLPVLPGPNDQCDPACSSSNPQCCPAPGQPCPSTCANGCPQETFPECFHGANNTNLHFHGTHVSPQAPQDYVLLDLAPVGTPANSGAHAHSRGLAATGQFQYAINPFPWNQAEGTHWYHPHKHGSVAVQLLNGMGGALLIKGPFDDWLNGFFKPAGGLGDKVLVIQQLDRELNYFDKTTGYNPPTPLINGQANPVVTMQPGEIQRWRLINETMQSSAQLTIGFESASAKTPTLKQIAQDGVQFAPANYGSQPLLTQGTQNLILSPGNRIDLLVQAPTTPGLHLLTYDVIGHLDPNLKARVDAQRKGLLQHLKGKNLKGNKLLQGAATAFAAAAAAATKPPLLTVNVVGTPKPMTFPTQAQWPATPSFLADIQTAEIQTDRTLLFSMTGVPAKQQNAFFINNKQFDPTCVDETMTLGKAEQWTVQNSSAPKHPFHIHTNPYQIIAQNGVALPAPWIWWDTFPLPPVATTPVDVNAGPIWNNADAQGKCPTVCTNAAGTWNGQWTTTVPGSQSVCGCLTWGSITTRSRFLDYTGEYVIHCHFLGHEDRGMMVSVQTVCPNTSNPLWGATVTAGSSDNCAVNLPASPQCSN